MIHKHIYLTLGLFFISINIANAQTMYRCVDDNGHTSLTNVATKRSGVKCSVIPLSDIPYTTSTRKATPSPYPKRTVASRTPTPSNFPGVPNNVQASRDSERKRILQDELNAEQQQLLEAKKSLASQPHNEIDRLKPYQEKVAMHERNIADLQKNITAIR